MKFSACIYPDWLVTPRPCLTTRLVVHPTEKSERKQWNCPPKPKFHWSWPRIDISLKPKHLHPGKHTVVADKSICGTSCNLSVWWSTRAQAGVLKVDTVRHGHHSYDAGRPDQKKKALATVYHLLQICSFLHDFVTAATSSRQLRATVSYWREHLFSCNQATKRDLSYYHGSLHGRGRLLLSYKRSQKFY